MKFYSITFKKIPDSLINNVFIITTVHAFLLMFNIDLKLGVLILLASIICFFRSFKSLNVNVVTILVTVYIIHCLASYLFNSYSFSSYYYSIIYEVSPILFFYIGQSRRYCTSVFYKGMIVCALVSGIVGYYLYFVNPGWYASYRYSAVEDTTNWDLFRFSSFWKSPYSISYLSCCSIIYSSRCIVLNKRVWFFLGTIFISLVSIILSQQRVALAFSCLVLLYMFFITCGRNTTSQTRKKMWCFFIGISVFVLILYYFVLSSLDAETMSFAFDKILSMKESGSIVADRVKIFGEWFNKPFPIFGDGSGRYSHAIADTGHAISDCEYLKIIFEKGMIGFLIFSIICFATIIRGMNLRKVYSVELIIILFYLFAMIGADPISGTETRPWLFWYCIGRINSKNLISSC